MSSYKAAIEVWWRSEDAMLSISSRLSEKKKKRTPTFPLVGRPTQVSFDHQRKSRLEVRISEAALTIYQKAITRAGATRTSPDKKNTPTSSPTYSKPVEKVVRQMAVADLNTLSNKMCKEELSSGSARGPKAHLFFKLKTKFTIQVKYCQNTPYGSAEGNRSRFN